MAEIGQPLIGGNQRAERLETHIPFGEMGIRFINIGRVTDDHFKLPVAKRGEPAAVQHRHIWQRQAFKIALGQRHRIGHDIYRSDLTVRALTGQRQGNGPGAGA